VPRCITCKVDKLDIDFAFQSLATGRRQTRCRACHAIARRAHYERTRPTYIANERNRVRGHRERNRLLLFAYLLEHPCVDCGENDPVVLDFDHRDPANKRLEVSKLAGRNPWPTVLEEIAKCDVRCASCHRRRTAKQFGWRRVLGVGSVFEGMSMQMLLTPEPIAAVATAYGVRKCRSCGLIQPLTEFALKNKATGCRSTLCRACQRIYSRQHYREHLATYLEKAQRHNRRGRDRFAAYMLEYFGSRPCVDCGETDAVVLEFDHRDGAHKLKTVGAFARSQDWDGLLAEIAKCDVRCVNCHRRRTARQLGWTRLKLQADSAA
jgi:hypothetical protein